MSSLDLAFAAVGGLLGLCAGAGLTFALLQRKMSAAHAAGSDAARTEASAVSAGLVASLEASKARAQEAASERDQARERLLALEKAHASAFATLQAERKAADERLADVQTAQDKLDQRMRETFTALASQTLETSGKRMLELTKAELQKHSETAKVDLEARQKAIESSLKPVDETLKKFGESLGYLEKVRLEGNTQLMTHLKAMTGEQQLLRTETSTLVKALRQPSVRGRWGEHTLRRVVEMAEMVPHCDFLEQKTVDADDGRLRPDLVVKMTEGRHVVVDAKVPLDKYLDMVDATDDASRAAFLKAHAQQVRDHITKLSSKQYWDALSPSPEMVVMFVPSEPLMASAFQVDPSLFEYGIARKVILASPASLILLLRSAAYGWRQQQVAKNAEEIRALGQELYTRIRAMAEHFHKLGNQLQSTVNSYNHAVGSLEGRVLSGARKFVELRAATADVELPLLEPIELAPRRLAADELRTRKVPRVDDSLQGNLLDEGTGSE